MISTKNIIQSLIKWGIYAVILVVVVIGITFGISSLFGTRPVVDVQAAESEERVGQVHLQQESVKLFYEETFPEQPSMIIPSASDAVQVSVTVLDNLSLHMENNQPKYATNWRFGATLHTDWLDESEVLYTVTADY